jgi:hypothetical protein
MTLIGFIASVLASNAVYRGFNARSDQAKVYEIGMCGFIAKHAVQKGKSNDCGTNVLGLMMMIMMSK